MSPRNATVGSVHHTYPSIYGWSTPGVDSNPLRDVEAEDLAVSVGVDFGGDQGVHVDHAAVFADLIVSASGRPGLVRIHL